MKQAERVRTGCLTQTRSVGRPRAEDRVAKTSVVVVASAAVEEATAVAVAGVAIPLVAGRVAAGRVAVGRTVEPPAVDGSSRSVVEPIEPAWPVVQLVVAKG